MENQFVKQFTVTVIGLFLSTVSFGQTAFYKVYSGNGYDKGEGIAQLPDSGFLVTGSSSSFEDAPSQVFLMRLDSTGAFKWSKAYGGIEFEEGKRVMPVPGFGYYLAGTSSSGPSANFDAYLIFTDEAGNQQWDVRTDQGAWERVHDAVLMADTSIVIIGETDSTVNGNIDLFAARYDKMGGLIWKQQWGTDHDDFGNAIVSISDTTVLIAGTYYVADSAQNKGYVTKMHVDGSLIWEETYGIQGDYWLNDICTVGANIKVIGERIKTGKTDHDGFFAHIQSDGTLSYAEEFYSTPDTRNGVFTPYTAATDKFFMTEQTINPGIPTFEEGEDVFVSRFNSGLFWDNYGVGYNGVGQDQANDIKPTSDGYAVMVGFHTTYGPGGNSVFVVKMGNDYAFPAPNSNPTIINIVFLEDLVALKSLKVYPNPVNDQLNIAIEDTEFDYALMDASGKQLLSGHSWSAQQLDFSQQAQGVYFLRVSHESGETVVVKLVK
ncbi:MAG: T9SS type A sorting domain-containing protein [Bacteroidota bacterium]